MAAIGADPEALDALARGLRSAAGDLDSTVRRIEAAIGRSGWSGPDAERFRRGWQSSHRRAIREGSSRCATLARRLDAHAAEQRRASLATGSSVGGPHLQGVPTEATVVRGVLTGSVGLVSASLAGTLTIDAIGNRRRVTYTDDVTAGVGATEGGGGRVAWNDHVIGKGATAGATASLEDRVTRTWTVEESALPMLLLGLAAEQGLAHSPLGMANRAISSAARTVDSVGDAVGSIVGVDVPDMSKRVSMSPLPAPERTEDLVGVVVGASAWATAIGEVAGTPSGADAAASVAFRVGTAEEAGHRSLLLEAHGSVAAAVLRATPLLASAREQFVGDPASIRVEVPSGSGSRAPVLITLTERAGASEDVVRVAIDPTVAPGAGEAARRTVGRFRDGDLPGALRSLRSLRAVDAAIRIDTSSVVVTTERAAAEGVGTVASLAVDGTIEHRSASPRR